MRHSQFIHKFIIYNYAKSCKVGNVSFVSITALPPNHFLPFPVKIYDKHLRNMELTDGSHESVLALAFSSWLFCQFAAIYLAGYWLFSQQPAGVEKSEVCCLAEVRVQIRQAAGCCRKAFSTLDLIKKQPARHFRLLAPVPVPVSCIYIPYIMSNSNAKHERIMNGKRRPLGG